MLLFGNGLLLVGLHLPHPTSTDWGSHLARPLKYFHLLATSFIFSTAFYSDITFLFTFTSSIFSVPATFPMKMFEFGNFFFQAMKLRQEMGNSITPSSSNSGSQMFDQTGDGFSQYVIFYVTLIRCS